MYRTKITIIIFTLASAFFAGGATAGSKGSLDRELSSLVKNTDSYLVTVTGEESWSNLIATGIILNDSGYIVTSSPTFAADDFKVTFKNGDSYDAERVGVDHESGLAVLKIKSDKKFKAPKRGSVSNLKENDWILVIGNSYDKPSTVNVGTYDGANEDGFLNLNINISPGSSGGAVMNTDGEIIAVVVAREFSFRTKEKTAHKKFLEDIVIFKNIDMRSVENALAVPIDEVEKITAQLIEYGEIKKGFLGISQKNLTEKQKKENNIKNGIIIVDVVRDSPADEAGLLEDDIITTIDGKKIEGTADLYKEVSSRKPGDEISLIYIHDGKSHEIRVELSDSEEDYFLGSWDIGKHFPKLKIGNKLIVSDMDDMDDELSELNKEMDRLREEIEILKEKIDK